MIRGRRAARTAPPDRDEASIAVPPRAERSLLDAGSVHSAIARDPIVAQIFAEQSLGYACLSPRGDWLDGNARGYELAARYHASAERANALVELARRAVARGPDRGGWRLPGPDEGATLVIHVHRLDREIHHLHEDVLLVVMREWPAPRPTDAHHALTARQLQIARLLACRGLSYKEIAATLDVSEGTVRKHAEQIYRILGVHSRAELRKHFG